MALQREETSWPESTFAGERRPRRWVAAAIGLVVYLVLAGLLFSSAWRSPQTTAVGIGTDPILSIWFLRWVPFVPLSEVKRLRFELAREDPATAGARSGAA